MASGRKNKNQNFIKVKEREEKLIVLFINVSFYLSFKQNYIWIAK